MARAGSPACQGISECPLFNQKRIFKYLFSKWLYLLIHLFMYKTALGTEKAAVNMADKVFALKELKV